MRVSERQHCHCTIQGISKQREELEKRIPDLESQTQLKSDEVKRMKEIEVEIKKYEKEIENIRKSCGTLENEIKCLEEKIANVGGTELKAQKAKVEGLRSQVNFNDFSSHHNTKYLKLYYQSTVLEFALLTYVVSNFSQIDNTTNAMTKLEVQIKSAEKAIKKSEKSIADAEAELTQLEASLKQKLEERKELEEEAAKVLQTFKQLETVRFNSSLNEVLISSENKILTKNSFSGL
jgi:structural maintenance of chromosome 4